MTFAQQFREARQRAGLTQTQAAGALGVSRQTIANWETELRSPPPEPIRSQGQILEALEGLAKRSA